jgi:hypothetical protein
MKFERNMSNSSRLRRERGQALVEFALTIFIILFVIFVMIEFCMALYAWNVLGDAAREGVRYAIVHGANNTNCSGGPSGTPPGCDPNADNVKAVVQDYAQYSLKDVSGMTVTVQYLDGSNAPSNRVKVDISYPYVPWFSIPWISTLKTSAQGRIVN